MQPITPAGIPLVIPASLKAPDDKFGLLRVANPGFDALRARPEFKAFIDRLTDNMVADAADGPQTRMEWNIWSHSPGSLKFKYGNFEPADAAWRDQAVIVVQRRAGESYDTVIGDKVSSVNGKRMFGSLRGEVIGLYRMGDLGVSVSKKDGIDIGTAEDEGGFEMKVPFRMIAQPGEKVELEFATGVLGPDGLPSGNWGIGLGYWGRVVKVAAGEAQEIGSENDKRGTFTYLTRGADGKYTSRRESTLTLPLASGQNKV